MKWFDRHFKESTESKTAATGNVASALNEFVGRHVRAVRREAGVPPDATQCLEAVRIGRVSPASQAAVAKNDLLVSVDGKPSAPLVSVIPFERSREYTFYSRKQRQTTILETDGIEIGAAFRPSPEAVVATYSPASSDPDLLTILWECGDWANLERLSQWAVETFKGGCSQMVLLGAAMIERGRKREGLSIVQEYLQQHAKRFTANFTAIGYYYLGQALIEGRQANDGRDLLQGAFVYYPCDRIAAAVERAVGTRPAEVKKWLGKTFPGYNLLSLDSGRNVQLSATLRGLKPHQRIVVCVLASYRGNGPYNQFIRRYQRYSPDFSEFLPMLHVITLTRERRADRPHWYEAEDQARTSGIPLDVLWDQSGKLTETLNPHGSPWIVVLDSEGRVRYEHDDLEGPEVWDAVS